MSRSSVVKLVAKTEAVTLRQSVQLHRKVDTSPGALRGWTIELDHSLNTYDNELDLSAEASGRCLIVGRPTVTCQAVVREASVSAGWSVGGGDHVRQRYVEARCCEGFQLERRRFMNAEEIGKQASKKA